jgi:hypothetical protein
VTDPFLKTGITFAILNLLGTIPELNEQLYRYDNGSDSIDFSSLSNLVGILNGPVDLLLHK